MIFPKEKEERKRKKGKVTKELVDSFVEEYNNDVTIYNIAKKYDLSSKTVANYIKKRREDAKENPDLLAPKEIEERKKYSKTDEKIKDTICLYYNNDMSVKTISKLFRISESTVNSIIRERRKLALKEKRINYVAPTQEEFNKYLFDKDTERKYSSKDATKLLEKVKEEYIEDWKGYINELVGQ